MSGDDNNFTFKAIECPYKSHCTRLIDEGKEIACLRAITLLGAMEFNKEGDFSPLHHIHFRMQKYK